ncbi:MAG: gephyrin-like molybdotransferase Glp [bacterium]
MDMISYEEALRIVLDSSPELPSEKVPLARARGRVLREDITSDMDIPPFNKSAMDGYACRYADIDKPLTLIENIPAGHIPQKKIGQGECSKIMTGAMVPEGADYIALVEDSIIEENKKIRLVAKPKNSNICSQGEDIKQGERVLCSGTLIGPVEIAILATVGADPVSVSTLPKVGVIATGSELVEPHETPALCQIRNSNSYQLCAQIEKEGCLPHYMGIAQDSPEIINKMLNDAMKCCHVILLSGGVSMGDYDFVPQILKENTIRLFFEKIAVKPGKPTVFGSNGKNYFFGLPGNPVSTLIQFEMLVKPFLAKMRGYESLSLKVLAKLKKRITRKKSDRLSFIPVLLDENGCVEPVKYHGSAHIHSYYKAHGVIAIPPGTSEVSEGDMTKVILLG